MQRITGLSNIVSRWRKETNLVEEKISLAARMNYFLKLLTESGRENLNLIQGSQKLGEIRDGVLHVYIEAKDVTEREMRNSIDITQAAYTQLVALAARYQKINQELVILETS